MYLEYKIQSICWLIFEQLYLLLSLRYPDLVPIISLQVSCVLRGLAPTPAPWIGLQWSEPIWIIPCTQHRIPFKDVLVPKGLSVLCISPESLHRAESELIQEHSFFVIPHYSICWSWKKKYVAPVPYILPLTL